MNENRISNSIFKHNLIDLAVSLEGVSNYILKYINNTLIHIAINELVSYQVNAMEFTKLELIRNKERSQSVLRVHVRVVVREFPDSGFPRVCFCPESCISPCPNGTGPCFSNQKFNIKTLMRERETEREREIEIEREEIIKSYPSLNETT